MSDIDWEAAALGFQSMLRDARRALGVSLACNLGQFAVILALLWSVVDYCKL